MNTMEWWLLLMVAGVALVWWGGGVIARTVRAFRDGLRDDQEKG